MTKKFILNSLQEQVFNALHKFNRDASFDYVEWLKEKHDASIVTAPAEEKKAEPVVQEFQTPAAIPDNVYSKKVKIRMMRNGRNTTPDGVSFLIVDPEDQQLAQQIDEVTCSWISSTNSWNTAVVTRANGKSVTLVQTVPQFLKRANPKRKRQNRSAQNQPLNFSKAVY